MPALIKAVALAEERVERQRQLVERLRQRNLATEHARRLLDIMEQVVLNMQRFNRLRSELLTQDFPRNRLLRVIERTDFDRLAPEMRVERLSEGEVIASPNSVGDVYFLERGVVSITTGSAKNRSLQVGLVGSEGLVETSAILHAERPPFEHVIHFEGEAIVLPAGFLVKAVEESVALRHVLLKYSHVLQVQMAENVVSSASSRIEPRLARSLLMYHDRSDSDELGLSHGLLADMLGVRRASVTEAVHMLEGQGMIAGRRMSIRIRDREGLKALAGDAYGLPEAEIERLLPQP